MNFPISIKFVVPEYYRFSELGLSSKDSTITFTNDEEMFKTIYRVGNVEWPYVDPYTVIGELIMNGYWDYWGRSSIKLTLVA